MKIMKILLLITIIISYTESADQGDWVDVFKFEIGLLVKPFYAGYLNITSKLYHLIIRYQILNQL